jgi:hypothetical protein
VIEELDRKTYFKMKELTREGHYAPMKVINDPVQGFMVKAAEPIPKFTILCEYAG